MRIFDNPRKILGKTIKFEDRGRCRDCGWFENGDTCSPGIDCPTKLRTEKVLSIGYRVDEKGMQYEVNKHIVFHQDKIETVEIADDANG